MNDKFEELKAALLEECKDDHVGLWSVIFDVKTTFKDKNPVKVKEITLQVIKDLLDAKLIVAGFPTKDGRNFEAWDYSTEEIISRISSEWDALGTEPNLGDIVWFTSID